MYENAGPPLTGTPQLNWVGGGGVGLSTHMLMGPVLLLLMNADCGLVTEAHDGRLSFESPALLP